VGPGRTGKAVGPGVSGELLGENSPCYELFASPFGSSGGLATLAAIRRASNCYTID
jgi:hypothetical protein